CRDQSRAYSSNGRRKPLYSPLRPVGGQRQTLSQITRGAASNFCVLVANCHEFCAQRDIRFTVQPPPAEHVQERPGTFTGAGVFLCRSAAQTALRTMAASATKLGMNPAIIPNTKHQVIVISPSADEKNVPRPDR